MQGPGGRDFIQVMGFKLEKHMVFHLAHMGQRLSLASLWFLSSLMLLELRGYKPGEGRRGLLWGGRIRNTDFWSQII